MGENDTASTSAKGQPRGDERSTARQAIAEVFSHLRISRVVYVDDVFEHRDREAARVLGLMEEALTKGVERWERVFPGVPFAEDRGLWFPLLEERWAELEPTKKDDIVRDLYETVYPDDSDDLENLQQDFAAISVLRDLVPEGVDRKEVGPTRWANDADRLMRAPDGSRVLCLFDRDLRHAQEFSHERSVDGVDLLVEAIAAYQTRTEDAGEVVFGIFSHTFSPNNELVEGRKIAEDHGLNLDDFLPLSKVRQRNEVELAKGLQMVVLNMFCARLKDTAATALRQAHNEAHKRVLALGVYDFDEMVLRSSEVEGAWEADTLFRLFQIFHRDAARGEIQKPEVAERFNNDVADARHVSRQRVNGETHPPERLYDLRHQELYLSGDLLNPFHVPLRSGDIFRVKWLGRSPKHYILLAQPCDLAVRSNGRRNPPDATVSLLLVEKMKRHKLRELRSKYTLKGVDFLSTNGLIRYYEEESSDVGVVRFKEPLTVRAAVLDLAVLSEDGSCTFTVENPAVCPVQFNEGWRARREFLIDEFREKYERLVKLKKSLGAVRNLESHNLLWSGAVRSTLALGDQFGPELFADGGFEFGIRRVKHFREPGTSRLLNTYTRFLSRPADAHDFADEARRAIATT